MLTEEQRGHAAHHILQNRSDRGDDHHDRHERTAALQHQDAGTKSNRREECVLKRRLKSRVEGRSRDTRCVKQREQRCHRQPADHGRRNVVAGEQRDLPFEAVADK
jgi:hypothetical protein